MLELLNEEEKVLEIIQNMPEVQQVVTEREKQSCKCTELASKFVLRLLDLNGQYYNQVIQENQLVGLTAEL